MKTCFFCGKDIEFRFSADGVYPLHLHGATCSYGRVRELKASQDFCHATRCPRCRRDVYFVRHNGGSVWLDDPGYPWLKHWCMYNDSRSIERKLAFDVDGDIDPSFSLGCVLDAMEGRDKSEFIVAFHDHRVAHLVTAGKGHLGALKGQLLFFSEKEMLCRYHVAFDDLFGDERRVAWRRIEELAWLPV